MAERKSTKKTESVLSGPRDEKSKVEFIYVAPSARDVRLAGSFNDWDPEVLPMKKNRKGEWKATVKLAPGRYEYKYFVDGSWVTDEQCQEMTVNTFGTSNCIITVGPKMAA